MKFLNRLLLVVLLFLSFNTSAKNSVDYNIPVHNQPDIAVINAKLDSMFYTNKFLVKEPTYIAVDTPRYFNDKTIDFYLLLFLSVLLGIVRYSNPKYFNNLFKVFVNPSQSSVAREQIEISAAPNIVMNMFFFMVGGVYIYYLFGHFGLFALNATGKIRTILLAIGGIAGIYVGKYFILSFTGWAFKIKHISKQYLFNVFFINKLLAVMLLPVVVILGFASSNVSQPMLIISSFIVVILFFYRYILSFRVYGAFFQYSWFHFFTYLCASEILPMAVLLKLIFMNS